MAAAAVPANRRSLRDAERSASAGSAMTPACASTPTPARKRSVSKDSTSRSACTATTRRHSAICLPMCCTQRATSRTHGAGARRRSAPVDLAGIRRGHPGRSADGHGDAAGALRDVPRPRAAARTPARCAHCHGSGRGQVRARAHGLLEAVSALRRSRATASGPLPVVRRRPGAGANRIDRRSRCRRVSPTARACA